MTDNVSIDTQPKVKYIKVHFDPDAVYGFTIDVLAAFPDTFLGRRVTNMDKYSTVKVEADTAHISINYTPLYFEHVKAWYLTQCLYLPNIQEAKLYYTIMDFWGIPHEGNVLDMAAAVAKELEMKFDGVIEAFRQITAGLRGIPGQPGCYGPPGCPGPPGRRGPDGRDGRDGHSGPTGSTGPPDLTGPAGPEGHQGPLGDHGPRGPEGHQGPLGDQGPPDLTGPTGPQESGV